MMLNRFSVIIVAVVAVLLQVVVAPIVPVFQAVPSFILPFVVVMAILRPADSNYLFAFVLGLLSDLLAQTPVGLSALLLLLASFVLSRSFAVLDKSTVTMPAIAVFVSLFAVKLLELVVLMVLGYPGSPVTLFLEAVLPAVVVDGVIGLIYYFIASKLNLTQESTNAWATVNNTRFH